MFFEPPGYFVVAKCKNPNCSYCSCLLLVDLPVTCMDSGIEFMTAHDVKAIVRYLHTFRQPVLAAQGEILIQLSFLKCLCFICDIARSRIYLASSN